MRSALDFNNKLNRLIYIEVDVCSTAEWTCSHYAQHTCVRHDLWRAFLSSSPPVMHAERQRKPAALSALMTRCTWKCECVEASFAHTHTHTQPNPDPELHLMQDSPVAQALWLVQ